MTAAVWRRAVGSVVCEEYWQQTDVSSMAAFPIRAVLSPASTVLAATPCMNEAGHADSKQSE